MAGGRLGALAAVEATEPGQGGGAMSMAGARGRRWCRGRGRVSSERPRPSSSGETLARSRRDGETAAAGWWDRGEEEGEQ